MALQIADEGGDAEAGAELGQAGLAAGAGRLDDGVVGAIGEQGGEDADIHAMAAAIGAVAALDRQAGQSQVADRANYTILEAAGARRETSRPEFGVGLGLAAFASDL